MNVININDDPYVCAGDCPDGTIWVVTDYSIGSYEGSGDAYCYDGKSFYYKSLGHCSCYGPFERNGWEPIYKEEMLTVYTGGEGKMHEQILAMINSTT